MELETTGRPPMVVISCELSLIAFTLLFRSTSDFIDNAPAPTFIDGAVCDLIGNVDSSCWLSDELRDNAPNLFTSIGVEQDLREEPDRSLKFKLRSGLSSLRS